METSDPTVIAVPDGHIADVITYLEMTDRPEITIPESPLSIQAWAEPDSDEYLELFRAVGERWLWLSRLLLDKVELAAILGDERNELFKINDGLDVVGLIELDFRQPGQCEVGFLGLVPSYNGQGHGGWLMAQTLARAWRPVIDRVWLHTCTLDSPAALGFYRKAGFRAYKREVSMNKDPRLLGLLPDTAGPHIPIIS